MYFSTRKELRDFVKRSNNVEMVDKGADTPQGRRWLAKLVNTANYV